MSAHPDNDTTGSVPQQDRSRLMALATGHGVSQALHAFCQHNLVALLETAPRTARQMADERRLDPIALNRVLRLLVAIDILMIVNSNEVSNQHNASERETYYGLTSMGKLLVEPGMNGMVLHWMETPLWTAWGALGDSLLTRQAITNRRLPWSIMDSRRPNFTKIVHRDSMPMPLSP